jgi:hypothetical protein
MSVQEHNADLMEGFVYVRRIPKNWNWQQLPKLPSQDQIKELGTRSTVVADASTNHSFRQEICNWIKSLQQELETEKGELPREGDFIIWYEELDR